LRTAKETQPMGTTGETTNPFEGVRQRIDSICEKIKCCETCHLRLGECERELTVHFPVKMEDGRVKVFNCGM